MMNVCKRCKKRVFGSASACRKCRRLDYGSLRTGPGTKTTGLYDEGSHTHDADGRDRNVGEVEMPKPVETILVDSSVG